MGATGPKIKERMSTARGDIVRRFYPNGAPRRGAVSEADVERIVENVKRSVKKESRGLRAEEPGLDEATARFIHSF
jgi:hypothetical protein